MPENGTTVNRSILNKTMNIETRTSIIIVLKSRCNFEQIREPAYNRGQKALLVDNIYWLTL